MLDFERELVATLIGTSDVELRGRITAFVEASIDDMPEFLRLGVALESVAFAVLATARRDRRRELAGLVALLDASPIALVRQYVRLFRSLVLFAEQELSAA
jgi:hypothetical protein